MADETHVVLNILDAMQTHITLRLQTEIPEGDITRADVIKKGLLFDNKTQKNVQIGIQGGDHDFPEELDGIITLDKLPDIGFFIPAREVGGGEIWMRRGVVKIECFFIREGLAEDVAFAKAYQVMGRLTKAIKDTPVRDIPRDSFGERPITIQCYASSYFESGGPPRSYIFRGKAMWAALTEKT